jgi:hypothetical protein
MVLPGLAGHVLAVAAPVAVTLYYGSMAALRFVAGMTATLSGDERRADRALMVLRILRWDWHMPLVAQEKASQESGSRCDDQSSDL